MFYRNTSQCCWLSEMSHCRRVRNNRNVLFLEFAWSCRDTRNEWRLRFVALLACVVCYWNYVWLVSVVTLRNDVYCTASHRG